MGLDAPRGAPRVQRQGEGHEDAQAAGPAEQGDGLDQRGHGLADAPQQHHAAEGELQASHGSAARGEIEMEYEGGVRLVMQTPCGCAIPCHRGLLCVQRRQGHGAQRPALCLQQAVAPLGVAHGDLTQARQARVQLAHHLGQPGLGVSHQGDGVRAIQTCHQGPDPLQQVLGEHLGACLSRLEIEPGPAAAHHQEVQCQQGAVGQQDDPQQGECGTDHLCLSVGMVSRSAAGGRPPGPPGGARHPARSPAPRRRCPR